MIHSERRDAVTLLTIDRPERRNALDTEHCSALHAAVEGAVAAGARSIVVSGAGSAFCSGADLGGVYGGEFRTALYAMLHAITAAPVPVVAAVNGPAIGAGTQLAVAADLRVAAPSARFAVPTARLGLAVDPWTLRRLALLCGGGPARQLLLGCDDLDVDGAERCGLVQRRGNLDEALAWATDIAGLAPLTHAYNKLGLEQLFESDSPNPQVTAAFEGCWASEDFREGRAASAEKRAPRFSGH